MDRMTSDHFLSPFEIAGSALVKFSFDLREAGISSDQATDLVGNLIEEFSMGRCASLASAVASRIGRDHYVAFMHADGRLAHAVIACSPQHDGALKGDCVDVMGRQPLARMHERVERLTGKVTPVVGEILEASDFGDGELSAALTIAENLPWIRAVMRLPKLTDLKTVAEVIAENLAPIRDSFEAVTP